MRTFFDRFHHTAVLFVATVFLVSCSTSLKPPTVTETPAEGHGEETDSRKTPEYGDADRFSFMAPNRETPAFCFQIIDEPSVTPQFVERQLQKALAQLAQSPRWQRLHLTADGVRITNGCPQPPYLLQDGIQLPYSGAPVPDQQRNVGIASPETAFVWILPDERIRKLFGENPIHDLPEEYLCMGHTCAEVTKGLYLTPAELDDVQLLTGKLGGVLIW